MSAQPKREPSSKGTTRARVQVGRVNYHAHATHPEMAEDPDPSISGDPDPTLMI